MTYSGARRLDSALKSGRWAKDAALLGGLVVVGKRPANERQNSRSNRRRSGTGSFGR
jgi:hypothetical protein